MSSSLYECQVVHARFAPKAHRFAYRMFLFAFDLDELDTLHRRLRLFSLGGRNIYSLRESDFLPTDEPVFNRTESAAAPAREGSRLKERVVAHLAARGIDIAGGRVLLVTLPRVFGYLFNPVSFYFCYDRAGEPVATIAEVTNTFREMKPYTLGPETRREGLFANRVPKHFYVSPFSDVDVRFDFQLRVPGERLSVQIDDYTDGHRTLTSALVGTRRPLTDRSLAWFTLKYPLITLRVIGLIHWHALRLWWKAVPWFRKAARATEQRDLYRPHASLSPARQHAPLTPAKLPAHFDA